MKREGDFPHAPEKEKKIIICIKLLLLLKKNLVCIFNEVKASFQLLPLQKLVCFVFYQQCVCTSCLT